jgi:NAD(P)-dependent dehydrogenase (short-subunit alcohol dehydrogenase family)
LSAKPVLIIGGSSGIGKAVGRLLLEKRPEAVVIAGKNKKKLLSAEVEGSFGQVITNKDVADTAQLDLLLAEIDSKLRRCRSVGSQRQSFPSQTLFGKSIAPNQDAESPSFFAKRSASAFRDSLIDL